MDVVLLELTRQRMAAERNLLPRTLNSIRATWRYLRRGEIIHFPVTLTEQAAMRPEASSAREGNFPASAGSIGLEEFINHFAPHALPWQLHMYETTGTGWAYDVGFYFGLLGGPGAVLGGWSRR